MMDAKYHAHHHPSAPTSATACNKTSPMELLVAAVADARTVPAKVKPQAEKSKNGLRTTRR